MFFRGAIRFCTSWMMTNRWCKYHIVHYWWCTLLEGASMSRRVKKKLFSVRRRFSNYADAIGPQQDALAGFSL